MLVLFSLAHSVPPALAMIGLLFYSMACFWQWTQLLAARWAWSVQSLRVDVFGQMTLTNRSGQTWSFKLLPDSVVHPACVVLHLTDLVLQQEAGMLATSSKGNVFIRWLQPKRLLILPDQADAQALQALRVWLKWGLRE